MNKRCIINVATGEFYCKMQDRLESSFSACVNGVYYFDEWDGGRNESADYSAGKPDLMLWKNVLPPSSLPHSESPYGFKAHAFKAAFEKGYTSILWVDSPAQAVKEDVSPIFDKIEGEGYYVMSHIDPLENWVGNSALVAFDLSREDLKGMNLPSGSCYGFHMPDCYDSIFADFVKAEAKGLFQSEKITENGIEIGSHRHDEAILALLLKHYALPVFTHDPLFQSDSSECVIKSGEL